MSNHGNIDTENHRNFGEGSTLQDRLTFPTFADCPQLGGRDARYFGRDGQFTRHWCFLGEITSVATIIRLVFDVQDMAGRRGMRVACYDNDAGRKWMKGERPPRVGHAIAILYPQTKAFMDGSIGLRVEDNSLMTIIPHSLQELVAANDALWGPRPTMCCAPDCEESNDLKFCSRCRTVRYCSREHQAADWNTHRSICQATTALRIFTGKNWTTFNTRRLSF